LFAPTVARVELGAHDRSRPFRQYLESELHRPVEVVVAPSYAETLEALRRGDADAAMLGEYASRRAEQEGGIEPLVAPVAADETVPTYRSAIITRSDSGLHELSALYGVTFGLVDEQSTSGYLVPRAMLREAGLDPDADLSIQLFGHHRSVVEAVIRGDVQAGAAHESRLRPPSPEAGPDYARLRVLARSQPIPLGPLVVRASLDSRTRSLLAQAMLRIHEADPRAAEIIIRPGHRFTMASRQSTPTLKSIAALAGVSYATVSRVVNGGVNVAPETARRVEAIIRETGYVPNGNARMLQGQQFPLVGLIATLTPNDQDPPLALIADIQQQLQRLQIPFVVCPVDGHLVASPVPQLLRDRRLGAVLVTERHLADPELADLARTGFAILVVNGTAAPKGMIAAPLAELGDILTATLGLGLRVRS
jgi:phosphate/phosphite/phosphonate ABC transporter binding protein